MNDETRVSLVALVVALIALGLALGQILQQFLGTAEGFRHCQSSVIGPWARLTRRSWLWSQFRFETKYTTPHITIPYPEEETRVEFDRDSLIGNDTPWEVGATIRPAAARGAIAKGQSVSDLLKQWQYDRFLPLDSGSDTVSWLPFLHSIFEHEKTFAPPQDSSDENNAKVPPDKKKAGDGESRVVVRLKEHSWDLVPPDVVRPMATSIVGTVVVIAKRLGMSWSELDPSRGLMMAEGSGHNINSSSVVRGLGLVLQYSFRPELKEALLRAGSRPPVAFIPGHHSDRLLCGILPLGPALNNTTELWLIYRNGRVNIDTFFDTIRLPYECRIILEGAKATRPVQFDMHIAEAFAMTCTWVPVDRIDKNSIMWPLPVTEGLETPMYGGEGREALLRELRQQAETKYQNRGGVLRRLGRDPVEFVDIVVTALQEQNRGPATKEAISAESTSVHETLSSCYTAILQVFDVTNTRLNFADLVSAHLVMTTRATKWHYDTNTGSTLSATTFTEKLAAMYAADLTGEKAVVKHMRSRGCTMQDDEIEALWWMLILKGIVWFASVNIEFPQSTTPSYYFYSEVPVYIT